MRRAPQGLPEVLLRTGLLLLMAGSAAHAQRHWELIKIGGREYVTLENVVRFYGLAQDSIRTNAFRGPLGSTQFQMLSDDGREIFLNGVRQWLCFSAEQKDGEVLISRMDLVKTIEPILRPRAIRDLRAFTTVVLDAGHGGHDKGAIGRTGYEKTFTLDVARRLAPLLRATGLKTTLTRSTDVFVPLEERSAIANRTPDSIFVSIHFNSSNNQNAEGAEVFSIAPRGAPPTNSPTLRAHHLETERGNDFDEQSLVLATGIQHALIRRGGQPDRGVRRARFVVLAATSSPAVLVEGGFLSNTRESKLIANSGWRQRLAQAIAAGVIAYKRIVDSRTGAGDAAAAAGSRRDPAG